MINKFCKKPLWECNQKLVDVAQGRVPADLVIQHAKLVDVCTAEILDDMDVAVSEGRVAYVGHADHCIGEGTTIVDGTGKYLAPGFLDAHMHVESAMVGPAEYARAALPHGTVGIYMDPHECANVRGMEGVKVMMEDAARVPLKAMLTPPSCVPAVDGFEDNGATVTAKDIEEAMTWDCTVGLGEMMNYPGVLSKDKNVFGEIDTTLKADKVVTGHYSVPETDRGLNAYIAAGVSSCHESVRPDDIIAKIRLGMYGQLREGSAWHNLKNVSTVVTQRKIDTRFCNLVTDDIHPDTLLNHGHIDRILRMAVDLGIDPVVAIQMCTINTATAFGQNQDMGSVTPGKCADMVLLDDLKGFGVAKVWIDGDLVAEDGHITFDLKPFKWPEFMTNTMNVGMDITPETFAFKAVDENGNAIQAKEATARVIQCSAGDTITHEIRKTLPIQDGKIAACPEQDVLKLAVFDRHKASGRFSVGFASGFGIHGALAQTVSHDAHNLLVLGDNDEDMAIAANALMKCGGGEVAVVDGEIKAQVALPVCGLMSDERVDQVAAEVAKVEGVWREMGCTMPSPFMTLGLISLAVIPEIRLTNRGLVDCNAFKFIPVIVPDDEK